MKFKKIIGLVLTGLVLAGGLFAGGSKQSSGGLTIKPGVLSIGMEIGYPPMEYLDENGNPIGFDVQMANAIAA
jgi:polar amino acid transport system substrate-binding protein